MFHKVQNVFVERFNFISLDFCLAGHLSINTDFHVNDR